MTTKNTAPKKPADEPDDDNHSATTAHPPEHPASWGGDPNSGHANETPEKRDERLKTPKK